MEYQGKSFEGLRALCYERKGQRSLRLDRMLEINQNRVKEKTFPPSLISSPSSAVRTFAAVYEYAIGRCPRSRIKKFFPSR